MTYWVARGCLRYGRKDAAKILGGGGGGRPNLAQGAGKNSDKIYDALEFALKRITDILC